MYQAYTMLTCITTLALGLIISVLKVCFKFMMLKKFVYVNKLEHD